VGAGAAVEEAILWDKVTIGPGAKVRRAVIEDGVVVPPSFTIGYDLEADAQLFTVTEGGVVIVPNNVHPGRGLMRTQALARAGTPLTPTRLYLVRHGRVADGHAHRYHGNNDIGLSPEGERQVEDLAAQLASVPVAAVYASDLKRSLDGAARFCRGRDLEPRVVPEFREIHFGVWEGLSFEEIAEQYPEELAGRLRDLANFRIPRGESLRDSGTGWRPA
jgi:hypothetical protein